jgi:hypothetical protein
MNTKQHHISKHAPSIFQGRLTFAAVSKPHRVLAVEHPGEQVVFRVAIVLLGLLALCYLYFVTSSVINVIARKEALTQSVKISRSIGALEEQYFSLSQSITPESALALGLTPLTSPNYVSRPGNVSMADTQSKNRI